MTGRAREQRVDWEMLRKQVWQQQAHGNWRWDQIAVACGMAQSTLSRFVHGVGRDNALTADGFVAVVLWCHPGEPEAITRYLLTQTSVTVTAPTTTAGYPSTADSTVEEKPHDH